MKPTKPVTPAFATPRDRVLFLLANLFGRNQSRMAESLGVSQAAVAKISAGTRKPGMRFLRALSEHPRVNPAWLLQGEGEPLLAERTTTPEGGWPVPVSDVLLPGPPQLKGPTSGQLVLVPGAIYRPSLYYFRVTSVSLKMLAADEHVMEGDQILLESDSSLWKANARMLDGKLCAVARHADEVDHVELRRVRCLVEHGGRRLELVGVPQNVPPPSKDSSYDPVYRKNKRVCDIGVILPPPTMDDAPQAASIPNWESIAISDILAVAISLTRPL